jgi:CRISPR-associated protein Cmr5
MPIPKISNVTPSSGSIGSQVTIIGENFNDVNKVTFDGIPAEFTFKHPAQITATVPQNLTKQGQINIKVFQKGSQVKHQFLVTKSAQLQPPPPPSTDPQTTQTPATMANTTTTNPRDLDRSRATFAWQNIQSVKSQDNSKYEKEYKTIARRLPTLIQVNGLAQTLAFLKAKGDPQHLDAFNHLSGWVCHRFNWNDPDLLHKILSPTMDSQLYRLATSETLAFLQWLKRFAEAELAGEE